MLWYIWYGLFQLDKKIVIGNNYIPPVNKHVYFDSFYSKLICKFKMSSDITVCNRCQNQLQWRRYGN